MLPGIDVATTLSNEFYSVLASVSWRAFAPGLYNHDPFVHLSADERQEQLKKMRVRDVRRAGQRQRRKPKKEKGKALPKTFKKPE